MREIFPNNRKALFLVPKSKQRGNKKGNSPQTLNIPSSAELRDVTSLKGFHPLQGITPMMNHPLAILFLLSASVCLATTEPQGSNTCCSQKTESCNTDANTAITQAVLDYVEGWYSADAARMDRALSEHLAKRRIQADGQMMAVTKVWMVNATGEGWGQIEHPELGRKEITILSQTETMASVMLVSDKFVDYLHLAKSAGEWKVVNALWDYLPSATEGSDNVEEPKETEFED